MKEEEIILKRIHTLFSYCDPVHTAALHDSEGKMFQFSGFLHWLMIRTLPMFMLIFYVLILFRIIPYANSSIFIHAPFVSLLWSFLGLQSLFSKRFRLLSFYSVIANILMTLLLYQHVRYQKKMQEMCYNIINRINVIIFKSMKFGELNSCVNKGNVIFIRMVAFLK